MSYSLMVVYEGSAELGPVPVCRIADHDLTKSVAWFALERATSSAVALRDLNYEASVDASSQADRLRMVVATI